MVLQLCAPGEPLANDKCWGELENLQRKCNIWIRLKALSGFGWDEERGIVTAPEEVWDMEIMVSCCLMLILCYQKDPDITEFRDKPTANAIELEKIF